MKRFMKLTVSAALIIAISTAQCVFADVPMDTTTLFGPCEFHTNKNESTTGAVWTQTFAGEENSDWTINLATDIFSNKSTEMTTKIVADDVNHPTVLETTITGGLQCIRTDYNPYGDRYGYASFNKHARIFVMDIKFPAVSYGADWEQAINFGGKRDGEQWLGFIKYDVDNNTYSITGSTSNADTDLSSTPSTAALTTDIWYKLVVAQYGERRGAYLVNSEDSIVWKQVNSYPASYLTDEFKKLNTGFMLFRSSNTTESNGFKMRISNVKYIQYWMNVYAPSIAAVSNTTEVEPTVTSFEITSDQILESVSGLQLTDGETPINCTIQQIDKLSYDTNGAPLFYYKVEWSGELAFDTEYTIDCSSLKSLGNMPSENTITFKTRKYTISDSVLFEGTVAENSANVLSETTGDGEYVGIKDCITDLTNKKAVLNYKIIIDADSATANDMYIGAAAPDGGKWADLDSSNALARIGTNGEGNGCVYSDDISAGFVYETEKEYEILLAMEENRQSFYMIDPLTGKTVFTSSKNTAWNSANKIAMLYAPSGAGINDSYDISVDNLCYRQIDTTHSVEKGITVLTQTQDAGKTKITFNLLESLQNYPIFNGVVMGAVYKNGEMIGMEPIELKNQAVTFAVSKTFNFTVPNDADYVSILAFSDIAGGIKPIMWENLDLE